MAHRGEAGGLAAGRARHPSAAKASPADDVDRCAGCGYEPVRPPTAVRAVTGIVDLARALLDPMLGSGNHPPAAREKAMVGRVARLRDELHATTNRVERFGLMHRPSIDAVRVRTPTAATAVLAPGQVLHQLDLVAARLVAVLHAQAPSDWHRVADMGDSTVTLSRLVDDVLHPAHHDLLDLVGQQRVA